MKTTTAMTALAVALAGCAWEPPLPGGRAATPHDAGPRPNPNAVIAAYLNEVLKDPESARISNILGPTFINVPSEMLVQGTYGWGICFAVNAKNSYGGYTGSSVFTLIWRNGRVVRVYGDQRDNVFDRARAVNMCHAIKGGTAAVDAPKPLTNQFERQPTAQPISAQVVPTAASNTKFRPAACD